MCGLEFITLKSFKIVHMITLKGVTHNEIWGNMERVQALREEKEEVEARTELQLLEYGVKERQGLKKKVKGYKDLILQSNSKLQIFALSLIIWSKLLRSS